MVNILTPIQFSPSGDLRDNLRRATGNTDYSVIGLPGIFLEMIFTQRIISPHIISLEIPCVHFNRTLLDLESGAASSLF